MSRYLYLGGDCALETDEIVAIFDLDNASWSIDTRKFLSLSEKKGRVRNAAEDLPKSFAVCGDNSVILAQPNTAILAKRWETS